MTVKDEHIIERQGKKFILYTGLLAEAHEQGVLGIETTLVQLPHVDNGFVAVFHAKVTMPPKEKGGEKRVFTGVGDADPKNTGKLILLHMIRMAETRAKARALRDATNIGITAFEELGGDDEPEPQRRRQEPDPKPSKKTEQAAAHVPDIEALREEVKAAVVTVAEAENQEARDILQLAIKGAALTTPGGWTHYTVYDLQALKDWLAKRLDAVPV